MWFPAVTLPPNFVYDKLLEAAMHVSTDGTGCRLQDIKSQQVGCLGAHQHYHLRLNHPTTGALVRAKCRPPSTCCNRRRMGPCMLRTYRTRGKV